MDLFSLVWYNIHFTIVWLDNELADYIMVLVANQKTKYQMKDDLSLFLNENTVEFVNWLHTSLKQLQINANQSNDYFWPNFDRNVLILMFYLC